MGIVDDQHRAAAVLVHDREPLVDLPDHGLALAAVGIVDPELARDAPEQPVRSGLAAQHHHHARFEELLLERIEQLARHARLAGADAAHEQDQALALAHGAVEPRDRIALRRQLDVELLGRIAPERILGELEMMQVLHARLASVSRGRRSSSCAARRRRRRRRGLRGPGRARRRRRLSSMGSASSTASSSITAATTSSRSLASATRSSKVSPPTTTSSGSSSTHPPSRPRTTRTPRRPRRRASARRARPAAA